MEIKVSKERPGLFKAEREWVITFGDTGVVGVVRQRGEAHTWAVAEAEDGVVVRGECEGQTTAYAIEECAFAASDMMSAIAKRKLESVRVLADAMEKIGERMFTFAE